jgi:hypothetical protein
MVVTASPRAKSKLHEHYCWYCGAMVAVVPNCEGADGCNELCDACADGLQLGDTQGEVRPR